MEIFFLPEGADDIDLNITIIKEIFKHLKEIIPKSDLKMFYSVESNTEDKYHHTNFLIDSESPNLTLINVRTIIERYTGKNIYNERSIDLKKYDNRYGKGGCVYSSKRGQFYELLIE